MRRLQPKKRSVFRADQFRDPKRISEEDLQAIFKTYHIRSEEQRQLVKQRLDEFVKEFSDATGAASERRSADRKRLRKAIKQLKTTAQQINQLKRSGDLALGFISDALGPLLAAEWMVSKFPHDNYAPTKSAQRLYRGRSPTRTAIRAEKYFIEEHTLEARLKLVRRRSKEITTAVLKEIERGLLAVLQAFDLQPGSTGGRKPMVRRRYLIINLAELWSELGREVLTGPKSDFLAFCESVADAIGWPTEGMTSAAPRAVKVWQNRYRNWHR